MCMADTRERRIDGNEFGQVLSDFLNRLEQRAQRLRKARAGVAASKHRVVELLEKLAMVKQVSDMPNMSERRALLRKLQKEVNQHLEQYIEFPQLIETPDGMPVIDFKSAVEVPFSERNAVAALSALLRAGLLQRERQCVRCKQWFFAKKEDSKYCSSECQTTPTEELRAKKRAYMKGYYQLLKTTKVKRKRRIDETK
jgi:predicted DNA-binding transcriptional regulator